MSKRMTETQILSILKEAEAGIPAKELCHKYRIARLSIHNDLSMVAWKLLTSDN